MIQENRGLILQFRKFIILAILLTIAGFTFILSANSNNQGSKTIVTPHLNQKILKGKNLLYCSTFQLAWNELKDKIIKEDIKLQNEPSLVGVLNKKYASKADLSENSYVATAGYGKDNIINKINMALKSKFGKEAPEVKDKLGSESIIAYAFLYKNLVFNPTFENLKNPVRFDSAGNVKAFGIDKFEDKHKKIAEQITIPYYKNSEEFVIKLTPKLSNDEIFLAKIQPKTTLADTLKFAQDKINLFNNDYLDDGDTLQIPKFDFKIDHSYDELAGKRLLNKNFNHYVISKAIQNTSFKLNEKGAILKSEAKIIMLESCIMQQYKPKRLIFDKPFLIYLKEKQSKNPYLVIWVDNTELLVRK